MILTLALLMMGGADAAAPEEPRICRTEQKTGTRVSRNRVCLTRAEWAERERVARIERQQGLGMTQSRRQQGASGEIGF